MGHRPTPGRGLGRAPGRGLGPGERATLGLARRDVAEGHAPGQPGGHVARAHAPDQSQGVAVTAPSAGQGTPVTPAGQGQRVPVPASLRAVVVAPGHPMKDPVFTGGSPVP